MKRARYLLIPVILMALIIPTVNSAVEKVSQDNLASKDITAIGHEYNNKIRDKGGVLKDAMSEKGDLMILGSSELNSDVEQNPVNLFPFEGAEYDVSILGRAYFQSLQHTALLNSIKTADSDSKIAIVVSLQWFFNNDGIEASDYAANFSEYQFYKIFNDKNISHENKLYYAKRNNELLRGQNEYREEQIYSQLYIQDNLLSNTALTILKPYYKFKEYLLEMKDKTHTTNLLKQQKDNTESEVVKDIDWDKAYAEAVKQGMAAATNNPLNVEDSYYDTYLRDRYDSLENSLGDVDLLASKELEDYEYFLKIAKDKGVKPLIILMPVNGDYYDHLGITEDERIAYYDKLEALGNEYGFDVLNLKDRDYEKYYLMDVMHLGWKGWLNVNEEISQYYNEK